MELANQLPLTLAIQAPGGATAATMQPVVQPPLSNPATTSTAALGMIQYPSADFRLGCEVQGSMGPLFGWQLPAAVRAMQRRADEAFHHALLTGRPNPNAIGDATINGHHAIASITNAEDPGGFPPRPERGSLISEIALSYAQGNFDQAKEACLRFLSWATDNPDDPTAKKHLLFIQILFDACSQPQPLEGERIEVLLRIYLAGKSDEEIYITAMKLATLSSHLLRQQSQQPEISDQQAANMYLRGFNAVKLGGCLAHQLFKERKGKNPNYCRNVRQLCALAVRLLGTFTVGTLDPEIRLGHYIEALRFFYSSLSDQEKWVPLDTCDLPRGIDGWDAVFKNLLPGPNTHEWEWIEDCIADYRRVQEQG